MCNGLLAPEAHVPLPTGCEGEDDADFTGEGSQGGERADGVHKASWQQVRTEM